MRTISEAADNEDERAGTMVCPIFSILNTNYIYLQNDRNTRWKGFPLLVLKSLVF